MFGLRFYSPAMIACAALGALVLSAPDSFAANTRHHVHHGYRTDQSVRPYPRPQYEAAFPNTIDRSNQCIGGYRYMRHNYDWNRTPEQDEVPLACR